MRGMLSAAFVVGTLCLSGCGGGGGSSSVAANVSVTLDTRTVSVSANGVDPDVERFVNVRVSSDLPLFLDVQTTYEGVALANVTGADLGFLQLQIRFRAAGALPPGTYSDTVDLYACLDESCASQVAGSPFRIKTSYVVSASDATTVPTTLTLPETALLPHDVVDAALSRALNAVVMVSASPTNALYVYDLATNTERSVALGKVPTALSVSPDGMHAAVGHDALISYVDLAGIGSTAAPKLLNVSAPVFDLILDGYGYVHAFPAADQWVSLHTVNVAANTEAMSGSLYAKTVGKPTPAGDAFYVVDTMLTPQNIARYSIGADGSAQRTGAAPYWGDFPMCSDLWIGGDEASIYTACGNTFRTSDLRYTGQLPLTYKQGGYYKPIVDLSHSVSRQELALLDAGWCGAQGGAYCDTVIRLIASDALFTPLASFWVKPVPVSGNYYPLHGMFIFHGANGEKLVVGRLGGASGADQRHYLWRPVASNNLPAAAAQPPMTRLLTRSLPSRP